MAFVINDRVKETTTSTGTGTINLGGASTGFQSFVAGIGTANNTYYAIVGTTEWEVGIGTVTDAVTDTLSRDTVISSSNANSLVTFSAGTKDVFCTLPASTVALLTGTQTLTNKRIDPRVVSTASASSLTPDISAADIYAYTALASNLTINAPTGTPVNGNKLIFRILDNGVARTLTWNATYTAIGVTIPTTTTVSKMTYVGCIYNLANTRWDVIAVTTQA
jgi:hypothetical protein